MLILHIVDCVSLFILVFTMMVYADDADVPHVLSGYCCRRRQVD